MADQSNTRIRACAFCGRTEEEVSFLIPAQDGMTYICENCISVCAEFLDTHAAAFDDDGKPVTRAAALSAGQNLHIRFADRTADAVIKGVRESE